MCTCPHDLDAAGNCRYGCGYNSDLARYSGPVDLSEIAADDELIEDLRAGKAVDQDELNRMLAAWREEVVGEQLPSWRTAMHQAARRSAERKAAEGLRCTCPWYRRALRAVGHAALVFVVRPLARLVARLPWKARSW